MKLFVCLMFTLLVIAQAAPLFEKRIVAQSDDLFGNALKDRGDLGDVLDGKLSHILYAFCGYSKCLIQIHTTKV